MSNTEQRLLTKESLQTAYLQLAQEQRPDTITVAALTRRAGVSRTAFYRCYRTLSQLPEELRRETSLYYEHLLQDPLLQTDPETWFVHFFVDMKAHAEMILARYRAMVPIAAMDWQNPTETGAGMRVYWYQAFLGALTTVLSGWVMGGMKESPEEMARFCKRVLVPLIPPRSETNPGKGHRKA